MLWLAFISHAGRDLLWDRSSRFTLLPRVTLSEIKICQNKINLWIGSMTTKFINVLLESNCTGRFPLFSKSLLCSKIFIREKSRNLQCQP